jgi:predicted phosphate transport protein (TIGR00153 family)
MSGFNSIMKIFVPKNKIFYELFENVANNGALMGGKLRELVAEPDFDKRAGIIKQIEDLEHANDELTHNIFTELGRNFITPFDREDIHYLATALDDIADTINASAKKINFYKVNPNDIGIQKLAEIIEQSAKLVNVAVTQLRDMKNLRQVTESLVKINSLENQADDVFDMSIERLFETEPDAKEVIKKREIYTVMEVATDKCEDAANVIESIIIKYA